MVRLYLSNLHEYVTGGTPAAHWAEALAETEGAQAAEGAQGPDGEVFDETDGALVAGESPEGETLEGEPLEAAPAEDGAAAEAVSETADAVTSEAPAPAVTPDRDVQ